LTCGWTGQPTSLIGTVTLGPKGGGNKAHGTDADYLCWCKSTLLKHGELSLAC